MKQKIVPHLWYDKEAREAAEFYISLFPSSKFLSSTVLPDTPSGDVEYVLFSLNGFKFSALSAGPFFKFNPSISFIVMFDPSRNVRAEEWFDEVWGGLSDGGRVLVPLSETYFGKQYGWVQDRYGLSWQLVLLRRGGEEPPSIIPMLLFTEKVYGKAEEAAHYYVSVFKNALHGQVVRHGPDSPYEKEGTVMYMDFMLENQWFAAADSGLKHGFSFNEAVSFMVYCEDQEEIDYYWGRLSAYPEAEQCGWLKDRWGVSWQIVPEIMDEMLTKGTSSQLRRLVKATLEMKKLDLSKLMQEFDASSTNSNPSKTQKHTRL